LRTHVQKVAEVAQQLPKMQEKADEDMHADI
jgi:hypothetical protein